MPETIAQPQKPRWRLAIDTIASLAMIAAAVVLIWQRTIGSGSTAHPLPEIPKAPVSLDGAALMGSGRARVVMIEYSDFQCPYCGRFSRETLPSIERDYVRTEQVRLAFLHLPLPSHQFAQKAAEAAECAGRQGRFWQMHDLLFSNQSELDQSALGKWASAAGADDKLFAKCLKGEASEKVRTDAAGAEVFKIRGTPAFLFGMVQADGRVRVLSTLAGAVPFVAFKENLDKALAAAGPR